jgi:hypothetical protein
MPTLSFGAKLNIAWHRGCAKANQIKTAAKDVVGALHAKISNTDEWNPSIKSLYEYRFKRINQNDCLAIGAAAVTAAGVATATAAIFGKPFLAMGVIGGYVIFLTSCLYVNQRICGIYKEETWEELNQLRQEIHQLPPQDQDLAPCLEQLKVLHKSCQLKPLPEKVVQEIEGLNKKVNDLCQKPQNIAGPLANENFKNAKLILIKDVENIQIMLSSHRVLPQLAQNLDLEV